MVSNLFIMVGSVRLLRLLWTEQIYQVFGLLNKTITLHTTNKQYITCTHEVVLLMLW